MSSLGKLEGIELTSLGLGKGAVKIKDHLIDKVADVVGMATAYKELPVVRESVRSGFSLQRGTVPYFYVNFYPVHPVPAPLGI